jgi:NAD-dependent SIR2 family protein deacetylase
MSVASIKQVAEKIRSGGLRVSCLFGAGISVGAGIPDFRSPGGMYDTLRPELLTATEAQRRAMRSDPTQVVSIDVFAENQLPYLELRRPFILGVAEKRWKPTVRVDGV